VSLKPEYCLIVINIDPGQLEAAHQWWADLGERRGEFVSDFYASFIEASPTAAKLLAGDLAVQEQRLLQMIDFVVHSATNMQSVAPVIEDLGMLHEQRGVAPGDYRHFKYSFKLTVEKYAEDVASRISCSEALKAWEYVLTLMSDLMVSRPGCP